MAAFGRIAELASSIHEHALRVDEYISSRGLKSPSVDVSMPAQLRLPEMIERSSTAVIEATSEFHSRMLGPMGSINNCFATVEIMVLLKENTQVLGLNSRLYAGTIEDTVSIPLFKLTALR